MLATMTELKAYVEVCAGTRYPDIGFCFNGVHIEPTHTHSVGRTPHTEKSVFVFSVQLHNQNCFEICMTGKSESELFDPSIGFAKHWIKLHELEVEQIKFQDAFLKNCQIVHHIDDSWIEEKKQWGLDICRTCRHTGELRYNGCVSVTFGQPIWQWYILELQQT